MGIQLDRVINENYEKLNTVDQHILQFVQANLESCKKMNIADLAKHCSVSTATILRTAQKLNFSGYSEFKYFLRSDSAENAEVLNLIEILNQDISQTTKLFLQNSQILDICRLIEQSSRIYAYGTGQGQRLMLQELARCFLNVNKNIVIIPTHTELKIVKKYMRPDDLLFVASWSGNIEKYRETLLNLSLMKIPLVSVTTMSNNELAEISAYNLYYQSTAVNKEMNINRSSYLTLHLVLHLLYDQYINYLNQPEDSSHA